MAGVAEIPGCRAALAMTLLVLWCRAGHKNYLKNVGNDKGRTWERVNSKWDKLMSNLQTQIPSDTWVTASWEEYIQVIDSEEVDEKAKCYYHQGELRIEMSPVAHDHSCAHAIISFAVNLFGIIKGIPLSGSLGYVYY